jgi:spore germination protein YaaH
MDDERPLEEEKTKLSDQQSENSDANINSETKDTTNESESGSRSSKQKWLIVGGIAIVGVFLVAGLLLPPISLGERLGSSDESETAPSADEVESASVNSDEISVAPTSGGEDVDVSTFSMEAFSGGEAGEEWVAAAASIPQSLVLSSNVYVIGLNEDTAQGTVEIDIPASAQPYQTLDLYGWDGSQWNFIPSQVLDDGQRLSSAGVPLPQVIALMQTLELSEPEIAAEVLPSQSLPPAVLPFLTEVTAGTLTLAPDGSLLGEAVEIPTGGYRQFVRVTNTGAIVDVISLSALLSDPNAQARNIQELIETANEGGFSGVNLDYQGVDSNQREAFSTFVDDLATALREEGLDLIVTLETPIQMEGGWDTAGQDWRAIGKAADTIYAQMPLDPSAYDDTGLAEQMIVWATRQVDRYKLAGLVSINAVDRVGETHRELPNNEALFDFGQIHLTQGSTEAEPGDSIEVALSGATSALDWDPGSLTYKYTYEEAGQPHDVWLGSEAVLNHRNRLPNRYNLRGVAVRGLGDLPEGAGYATALRSYLGKADAPQPASAAIVWAVEDENGGVVASSSGEEMMYAWQAPEEPGVYTIRADFAQGDGIASLGTVDIFIEDPGLPTPTPKPTQDIVVEATPTAETVASAPTSIDPGNADAAANTPANVRSGPGLGYGIVGGLDTGEAVELIGRNEAGTWLQFNLGDGSEGWVFGNLLTVNPALDVNLLAVVEVEAPVAAAGSSGGEGDSGGSSGSGAAPPPVIAPAPGGFFELGGQTHTLANPSLMSMAGMNWVKFQHKWGPGDTPDAVAGRIQQAHANGFKVLLSIPGSSTYPSSIDFNSYVQFLGGVAALGPDAIEVWNEENIDFEWPAGQIDPASYVNNMLAPAYNAIKSANSSVMVVSGAPAPTGFDNGTNAWSDSRYMAGVAAAGGGNYMDCIGVHHNAGATSPSTSSGHPAGNNHYSWYFFPTLNMYYNSFGGARPVCFTELGFLSGQDFGGVPSRFNWAANTTVDQHAQWLAEATSLSASSGKVRMLIIFNVDFTLWSDDPQAGYAMLRPNGSCPSCGLLGQVMGTG